MTHIQLTNTTSSKKIRIFKILAIAAMTLLLIDTLDTFIAQGKHGFLPLNDQQRGILLGVSSIVLFFLSFWIGFRENSKLTTSLFISGGILLAGSKLVEPSMGLNLFLTIALPYLYTSLIVIGFILIGLGLFRVTKRL
ncbi:MAG TPA: hypothetical protein VH500_07080 [Nitrososphaeraceae archaeon]|jgi:hypothetical protein